MYDRTVKDKTLTLTVSGYLWNSSLVMLDLETKSYWSHLLGEAKAGPLEQETLDHIPSLMTDWATFREEHPDGTVVLLPPTAHIFNQDVYAIEPGTYVLGIFHDGNAYAWSLPYMKKEVLIQQKLGDTEVVICYDERNFTSRMFERRLDNAPLDFFINDEGFLCDKQTKSEWNHITGKCLSGEYAGRFLTPMPAIMSFKEAWTDFHPDSKIMERN